MTLSTTEKESMKEEKSFVSGDSVGSSDPSNGASLTESKTERTETSITNPQTTISIDAKNDLDTKNSKEPSSLPCTPAAAVLSTEKDNIDQPNTKIQPKAVTEEDPIIYENQDNDEKSKLNVEANLNNNHDDNKVDKLRQQDLGNEDQPDLEKSKEKCEGGAKLLIESKDGDDNKDDAQETKLTPNEEMVVKIRRGSEPLTINKPHVGELDLTNEARDTPGDLPEPDDYASSPRLSKECCVIADRCEHALSSTKLHSGWTLYVDKTPTAGSSLEDYTQNLRKIYKVETIEGFWQVFNNIPTPNRLHARYSFHLMRGDRRPVWEDPLNENGGYWKLKCHKNNTEAVWKELVLCAIGEQFRGSLPDTDNVVGVSVSIRERDDHFQIWNENWEGNAQSTILELVTKKLLPKTKFHSTFYKEHKNHHKFEKKGNTQSTSDDKGFKSGKKNKKYNAKKAAKK